MTGMMIAAVAAPAIAGVVGNLMGAGDKKRAQAAMAAAYHLYDGMNIPDSEKMKLALQSPEVQGVLQPFMQQAQQMQGTAMDSVQTDPRLKTAQMNALDTLSKMGQTGLNATDMAALNASRRQTAGDEHSREQGILQGLAERGAGGSGMELATKLASSQGAADRASQQSDQVMAMAQKRMLDSIAQAGQLGGQMRSQDFGEQSDIAKAKDQIAQFNASQRANTGAANTGALNAAQAANLAEKQRIADAGVNTSNAQQEYNKQLIQKQFDNQMQLNSAKANALVGQANNYNQQANQTGAMVSGIGAGIGQGLMAGAMMNKPAATPATPATSNLGMYNPATGAQNYRINPATGEKIPF